MQQTECTGSNDHRLKKAKGFNTNAIRMQAEATLLRDLRGEVIFGARRQV